MITADLAALVRRLIARLRWAILHALGIRDSLQIMGISDLEQFRRDFREGLSEGYDKAKGEAS